jgi:molecular chaperone GrpE (heat shock protein)
LKNKHKHNEQDITPKNILPESVPVEDTSTVVSEPDYKDLYTRSLADYQNMKNRYDKILAEKDRSVLANVMKNVVSPLYNDIQRGVKNGIDGCDIMIKNLEKSLDSENISVIGKDIIGKLFDTDMMEAVTSIITDDESKANTVADVMEYGFKDNKTGKVDVFSKVIVYNYGGC